MDSGRPTVTNGRTAGGKFAAGNRAASGTRQAHLQKLRSAFLDCLTVSDIADVTAALLTAAKAGDVAAIKVLFERVHGRVPVDVRALEDDEDLTDDQKRQLLLTRFARLSPEAQQQVRTQLREQRKAKA